MNIYSLGAPSLLASDVTVENNSDTVPFRAFREELLNQPFHSSTAILQVLLQANNEPFRNGLVEMKNRKIEKQTDLEHT